MIIYELTGTDDGWLSLARHLPPNPLSIHPLSGGISKELPVFTRRAK
jgi:hypothetical protein